MDHYQRRSEDRIQNGILLCNRIGKSRACWHIGNWASRSSSTTALQAKHKLKESMHVINIVPVLPVQRTGYTHQYPRIPGWRRSCNLVDRRTHSRPDGFGTTGLRKTGYLHCFVDIFIFKNSLTWFLLQSWVALAHSSISIWWNRIDSSKSNFGFKMKNNTQKGNLPWHPVPALLSS